MARLIRHFLLALASAWLVMGCSDSAKREDTRPDGARLTPKQALRIAKIAAEREGVDLREYKEPDVTYGSMRAKTWRIYFDGRVASPGNHFNIYIDDQTEETRYLGGR